MALKFEKAAQTGQSTALSRYAVIVAFDQALSAADFLFRFLPYELMLDSDLARHAASGVFSHKTNLLRSAHLFRFAIYPIHAQYLF